MHNSKLKEISKSISSGLTPLRSNETFWDCQDVFWLKTEQLGERYIYKTTEKISQKAINETSIKVYPENTISIAMYGEGRTRGNVSILKSVMATNQACCNIILNEKVADFKYIYYNLKTQYDNLRQLSAGVRKNLNSNDIKEFSISIPELKIQKEIASVLSALDDKIELNNKINSELEAMAKTLYDYWFVQFDFPDVKGKPYKTSGGKMVYNEELKREVPEGWEVKSLEELVDIQKGSLITEKTSISGCYKVVAGGLTFSYTHSFSNRKKNVITISGSGANAGYVNFWREEIFASDCTTIDSNHSVLTYIIYHHLIQIQDVIYNQAKGSAQPHVYPSDIKAILYFEIPKKILDKIEPIYNNINEKIGINLKQNNELSTLRDWLLPMLMNGQVSVGKAYQERDEVLSVAAENSFITKT